MAAQYSFVMKGLTKTFPGAPKPILNNISLQFYPDAKIGIVGPNGSGKSTLMKIMAQRDKEFTGEAWPGDGITVGYLRQEPQLDPTKTVKENVMDGVRPVADMMERFNVISAQMADPGDDFDALMAEMGELQEKIDAVDGWTLDNQLEIAMDALRCPPGDAGRQSLGRREAPRRADPPVVGETGYSLARRADQPPRRRKRPVARKAPRRLCRQRHPRHPRPLLPRQCRQLGARARSRPLLRLRIQLFRLSREESQAPRAGGARGKGQAEGDQRRAGVDPAVPQGAPGQVQGAHPKHSISWSRRRRTARRARRRS